MIINWALHLLIGCGAGLQLHPIWLVPLTALQWFSPKKLQGLSFCFLGILLCFQSRPPLQIDRQYGSGIFRLHSIAPANSPFHRSIAMHGILTRFNSNEKHLKKVPCVIFLKTLPKVANQYHVEGFYEEGKLLIGKTPIKALKSGFSLPFFRFFMKEKVRKWCHKINDKTVGHFYASILTGDVDDRLLSMEFRKWGLSHILAISGFHFALIALGFGFFFKLILPAQLKEIALIIVLTAAFFYFGPSASITRAYIMVGLFLLGQKLLRPSDPLNLLGVALLIELLFHPLNVEKIGFQLSYAATFGILTFYFPVNQILQRAFPIRNHKILETFSIMDKHGYLLICFLRNSLALSIAIHLMTLPLLLYHFGYFSLLSPIFNLFITPLLSLTILGIPLGQVNEAFTRFVLGICSHAPENFNFQWQISNFPIEVLICLLTIFAIFGLTLRKKMCENRMFPFQRRS